MDVGNADASFFGWLWAKLAWTIAPLMGSVLSVVIGKDYSPVRVVSGVFSGLFMAYYFTGWLTYYLPMPPNTPPGNAEGMVGALLGLTGYFLVNRLIELSKDGQLEVFWGLLGIKGGNAK